mmetsp:Transcript_27551/g.82944  ORF Transcript_27551/g.82944 Transcript_27551/m.82944 type:complete len:671 (+) Transcript_27551:97-2109(+)
MKIGSKAASPLNKLQNTILRSSLDHYADLNELQPLAEQEVNVLWQDVYRETSSRKKVYGLADSNRIERELIERFGLFKMLLVHPFSRRLVLSAEGLMKAHLVGDPILPIHAIKCVVLACLLFSVHPILVIGSLVGLSSLALCKRVPTRPLPNKVPVADIHSVLVYGGGLRGLYTAALLARAGLGVTVLVPEPWCEGGAIARPQGAPCDFILDRCEIGQISRYEALLSPCFHISKPVNFEPVGSAETGWAHGVLVTSNLCRPVPLRSGLQEWVDDVSHACGADRGMLRLALTQAIVVFGEMSSFIVAKLPDDASLLGKWKCKWAAFNTQNAPASFKTAASMTTMEAAGRFHPALSTASSFAQACTIGSLLREEHIPPREASFAAWSASVAHGIDGYYSPKGGISELCASLEATITTSGGRILTNTVIRTITLDSPESAYTTVLAMGVNGTPLSFTAEKVILAVDATECLRLIREANARPGFSVPPIVPEMPHAHPVVRTLIAFAGTCEELDAPLAVPVFWRNHADACDSHEIIEWKTLTLRDAPDNVVACVVEGPISSFETHTAAHSDLLNVIAQLFPRTKDKLLYINSLAPAACGFSHTPARYTAEPRALRPCIEGLDGVFLALDDFALSNAAGSVVAGYLAAHATLGYTNGHFRESKVLQGLFTVRLNT